MHWRKLKAFTSSAITLLAQPSEDSYLDAEMVVNLLRTRIVAEVRLMCTEEAAEIRRHVVRLFLGLLSVEGSSGREYALTHLCKWYQHHAEWKDSIEETFQELVSLIIPCGLLLSRSLMWQDTECRMAIHLTVASSCNLTAT